MVSRLQTFRAAPEPDRIVEITGFSEPPLFAVLGVPIQLEAN